MAKEKPILAGPAASAVSGYGFLSLPATESHAMAQFGETTTDIGHGFAQIIDQAEEDKQSLEAEGKILENYAIFEGKLALNPDYQSYDTLFKEFLKVQNRDVIKNIRHRGARERSRLQLLNLGGRWSAQIQERKWKAQAQAIYDQGFLAIEQGMQAGNIDHVDKGLALLTSNNQITPAGAERIRLKIQTGMSKQAEQRRGELEKEQRIQEVHQVGQTAAHIEQQAEDIGYVAVPYESESGEPELAFTDGQQYIDRMAIDRGWSTTEKNLAESYLERYKAISEIQKEDAKANYERDYLDRLYTLPIEELPDLQSEVLTHDELEPGDQQRLYKMVTDRVKAIKEGTETETDALIAGQLSDRAVLLDPNDKRAMRDFEIEVMGSDQLSDEDKASIRSTARTEFSRHQQTQLSLSHQDARNIVRPLQNKEMAQLQWLENRRKRGLPMKGKEYEKDFLRWATTRTREEEIQGIEKRISVDCTAAMNAFAATEKGRAMTPNSLRKELNVILGEHIALRDQMTRYDKTSWGPEDVDVYQKTVKGPLSSPPKTVLKSHTVKDAYVRQHKQDENLKNSGYGDIPNEVWDKYSAEQVRRYMEWASEGYKLTVQDGKIGWQKP